MSQLNKIIDAVGHFYKLAGLLQVPENALKEMNDWLEACYCSEVAAELKKNIELNSKREKSFATFRGKFTAPYEIQQTIYELKYAKDKNKQIEFIDRLIDIGWTELPKFNKKTDPSTGMEGVVEEYGNSFSFFICRNDEGSAGQYYYDLNIDHCERKEIEEVKITEDHPSVSLEQLIKLLVKNYNNISWVVMEFDDFTSKYQTYDDKYLKQLQMALAYCMNKSKNIPNMSSSWENNADFGSKQIEIKGSDLPYARGEGKNVKIRVEYVKTDKEAKTIDNGKSNGAGGLWYQNIQGDHVGIIFVMSPYLIAHNKEITSLHKLKENITNIQTTGRHELQHFVQTYLKSLHGKEGGLPSKKLRDKRIDNHGRPLSLLPLEEEDYYGRIIHPLRDVEFYTRLSDSVENFNRAKRYFPLQLHQDFMLNYIGRIGDEEFKNKAIRILKLNTNLSFNDYGEEYPEEILSQYEKILNEIYSITYTGKKFFNALKEHQPLKYGKAVGVFANAVGL